MREMTQKEKNKYKQLVSEAQQLRFDIGFFESGNDNEGLPLYICKDGHMQYFFSRYPADDTADEYSANEKDNCELRNEGGDDTAADNELSFFDSGMFQLGFNFFES